MTPLTPGPSRPDAGRVGPGDADKDVDEDLSEDALPGSADAVDPSLTPARCRKRAMDALARREQTRKELERRLLRAGFAPETVADTLDALADEGLQSDARFAEAFISSRYRQGKGTVRIRAELSQRGFDRSAIAEALQQSDFDWFALACEVRAQRFGDRAPEDFKARARQLQFLAYRGFDSEQAQAAVPDH
ncbi:MAG: regulatory protein RecX [Pseudomonadota bacterium]